MARVTIKVLKKYFKNQVNGRSCRGSGSNCPVALALIDAGFESVFVDGIMIEAWKDGVMFQRMLPQRVKKFIERFDNEKIPLSTFKPFSFGLNVY